VLGLSIGLVEPDIGSWQSCILYISTVIDRKYTKSFFLHHHVPTILTDIQDSTDLAEDQAGPSTVLRSASGAPPHTPGTPVLPRDAPPPRQRAHRTITDLAPRESRDESLDSDCSEGSAQ